MAKLWSYNDLDSIIYSDSAIITSGKFTFKGKELLEGFTEIWIDKDDKFVYSQLFLERGDISLYLGENEKYNKLHGTPFNDLYQSHQDSIYYYVSEIDRLTPDPSPGGASFKGGTELADAWNNYGAYFIRFKGRNINNIVGRSEFLSEIVNIPESFYRMMNKLSFYEMYDFLDSAMLNHPKVLKYLEDEQNRIIKDKERKLIEDAKYTDFELITPEGEKKRLSDYVGKHEYVYLDFWASWCGPCIADLPYLKELYAKYHDKGLEIVGITIDEKKENWTDAIVRNEIPWINLWSPENISVISKAYGQEGVPYGVLIDKSGNILSLGGQSSSLKMKLESL